MADMKTKAISINLVILLSMIFPMLAHAASVTMLANGFCHFAQP